MKKSQLLLSIMFTIAMTVSFTGCSSDDDESLSPALSETDIIILSQNNYIYDNYVEKGSNFLINVDPLSFYSKVDNVSLTDIKLVNENDEIVAETSYSKECNLNVDANKLNHGENELTIKGVFSKDNIRVEKNLKRISLICFNELPEVHFGGSIISTIKWETDDGAIYKHTLYRTSNTPTIAFAFNIRWETANGEIFDGHRPLTFMLNPFIVAEKTNFDAELTCEGVHWISYDAPLSDFTYTADALLGLNVTAFVEANVKGVHEGIEIDEDHVIIYNIVNTFEETEI